MLALLFGAPAGPALAEETAAPDSAETLFDVIRTLPDRLVPKVSADDQRSADDLYAAAISELQAARFGEARRLLELFVVRDPQHPSVPEARRHLSELYQLDNQAPPSASPETAAVGAGATAASPLLIRQVESPKSVGGRLEDSFMLEAGDRVFFAPRSSELGSRARSVLAAQARWLKRNGSLSAVVEGHSDDPSLDDEGLRRLAVERAEAVLRRLIEEGVEADRLAISPLGKTRPVATCTGADCAAQNRRAVTVLTPQRVTELPHSGLLGGPQRP